MKEDCKFTKLDLILGAIYVRINRLIKKILRRHDINKVTKGLFIGGRPLLLLKGFKIINLEGYIEENNVPSLTTVVSINNEIERAVKNNDKVLLHCRLGRSRAPMIAVYYLMNQGFNIDNCIRIVREVRKGVFLNKKQLKFLRRFE